MAAAAPDIALVFKAGRVTGQRAVSAGSIIFLWKKTSISTDATFGLCLVGQNCATLELQLQSRLSKQVFVWG